MNKNKSTQINLDTIEALKSRFDQNTHRHPNLDWSAVENKLKSNPGKLETILKMESTGGEPDVVNFKENSKEITFVDCSKESPSERRSLCYDKKALVSRKKFKPKNSALDMAEEIGIKVLSEEDYYKLQQIEPFDTKTSSWLETPKKIRELGGAIFADYRFGRVFTYHNGAESYYASRGFRGKLTL